MSDEFLSQLKSSLNEARLKYKSATDSFHKLNGQQSEVNSRKRPISVSHRDSENGVGRVANSSSATAGGGGGLGGSVAKRARPGATTSVFERLTGFRHHQPQQQTESAPASSPLSEYRRARKAAIKELVATEDTQVRERNKRMMGVMLGTLRQFSATERDRERQSAYQQRLELEQRVEEGVNREQERLRRERAKLAGERKLRLAEIQALEEQVRLVELHSTWRRSAEQLRGSIRTLADSHPHRLYYRPRIFCDRARRRRDLSARQLDAEIADRERRLRADVEKAIAAATTAATAANDDDEAKAEGDNCGDNANKSLSPPAPKRLLSSVAVVPPTQQQQQQLQQAETAAAAAPADSPLSKNSSPSPSPSPAPSPKQPQQQQHQSLEAAAESTDAAAAASTQSSTAS